MGDVHIVVVYDMRKVVCGIAVRLHDYEVLQQCEVELNVTADRVVEPQYAAVWHLHADDDLQSFCARLFDLRRRPVPSAVVIARRLAHRLLPVA